jgi:hypothetical protein
MSSFSGISCSHPELRWRKSDISPFQRRSVKGMTHCDYSKSRQYADLQAYRAAHPTLSSVCRVCGAEFSYPFRRGRGSKYCSETCRQKQARNKCAERKRRLRAIEHGLLRKECRWCGAGHTRRGQYCSEPCRKAGYKENQRRSRRAWHRRVREAGRAARERSKK